MAIERYRRRTPDKWEPLWALRGLQNEVDRLFADFSGEATEFNFASLTPALDLVDTSDDLKVKVELPGISKEDVDITINDGLLTVKGEKKAEREEKEANRYYVERRYGSFSRTITLPAKVKADKVKAKFTNGVLEIVLPKAEEEKVKRVHVSVE